MSDNSVRGIDVLFDPSVIAMVGASRNPRSFSAIMAERLWAARSDITLHLVNPGVDTIMGRATVGSVGDISDDVDVALIVLPAGRSLDALSECVRRGVPGVIMYAALPSGYAQFNDEVRRIIRGSDTRVLGPNTLGLCNLYNCASLTYGNLPDQPDGPGDLGVAVIGHSGAVLQGIAMHAAELGCGVGYLVSLGNESDLTFEDFLAYFIERPDIKVVAAYLEQIHDPQRFISLAERARVKGTEIVILRAGVSVTAQAIASSHTGAIVGAIDQEAAFMTELGVHLVRSTREAAVVASAVRAGASRTGGLAVLATSGGYATIIADIASSAGIDLPPLEAETKTEISSALAATQIVNAEVTNPLDLGVAGAQDRALFDRTVELLLGQDSVGGLLLLTTAARTEPAEYVVSQGQRCGKPVVLMTYLRDHAGLREIARRGVPVFASEDEALLGLAAIFRFAGDLLTPTFRTLVGGFDVDRDWLRIPAAVLDEPGEAGVKGWLSAAGLSSPLGIVVQSREEAVQAMNNLSRPVVLKVVDTRIVHKTEVGGVWTGIADTAELATAWSGMHERLAAHDIADPAAFLLEEQIDSAGFEWLVGVKNDFAFGPLVIFGAGGIVAEAMPDPVMVPAPLDVERAVRALRSFPAWCLLERRGAVDASATQLMAEFLVKVAALAWANRDRLSELDLNPVVLAAGRPVVLDAHLVVRAAPAYRC
jgi:acyl-CoA synthetase (NDP forming)